MLEQWSTSINEIKCVEPNEGMLKAFREAIHDPRVIASEGTFSSTEVESGWADLIVIATVSPRNKTISDVEVDVGLPRPFIGVKIWKQP